MARWLLDFNRKSRRARGQSGLKSAKSRYYRNFSLSRLKRRK